LRRKILKSIMKKSAILWLVAMRIVIAKAQEASGNNLGFDRAGNFLKAIKNG